MTVFYCMYFMNDYYTYSNKRKYFKTDSKDKSMMCESHKYKYKLKTYFPYISLWFIYIIILYFPTDAQKPK